jgi:hypothetical protein
MTCCTSPDVNLAEEVKFRPIECDRRLCGDFSLRRTNLPANADELLRRFRARAAQGQRVFVILGLESAPGATLRAISLLLLRRGRSTRRQRGCHGQVFSRAGDVVQRVTGLPPTRRALGEMRKLGSTCSNLLSPNAFSRHYRIEMFCASLVQSKQP